MIVNLMDGGRMPKFFLYRFLAVLILGAACPLVAEEMLRFGVYTADKPTTVVKKFRSRLNEIEANLNRGSSAPVRIKMQVAPDYARGVDDIIAGRVDFARLGPASYVEVKSRQPNIRILALESKHGKKRFNGVIVVRPDSRIESVTDLVGKRFAFGDRRSTIGRYLAQQHLLRAGIRDDDLAFYQYLGRHDKVGWAVALGKFDAGALKESTYKDLLRQGAALKVLATFPNVTKPWVARAGMDPKTYQRLRDALLAMGKEKFVSGADGDFDSIRAAMEESARFFTD